MRWRWKFWLGAAVAGCLASCGTVAPGAGTTASDREILPHDAAKGELFASYAPKAKSRWKSNWTSGLDFTGVSWNNPRTVTAIAPSYVVMAAHFPRSQKTPVMFHDKRGRPYERFITAYRRLERTDITVGKLNRPLPREIRTYSFATQEEATVGRPVFVTDQTRVVSVHRIADVYGKAVRFAYDPELDPVYRRKLIVGDSGNPSFLLVHGDLKLLETHTTGGSGGGPYYASPEIQASIRQAMEELEQVSAPSPVRRNAPIPRGLPSRRRP